MTYFNYRIPYSGYVTLARSILESITLLSVRVYLFTTFFFAGFNKLKNWESTLFLFEYEYAVPFLRHDFAAYLGTASEIILPSMLLLGLLTPFAALGLFIFNIVAVLSLADMAPAAFLLHVIWGGMIFSLIVWGAGRASLDNILFSAKGST
ncbi:DoxX family protein [uncultured Methylophaga sp.]|jgi:putative oxidoreductase|uniref:DoxX family protein n=1 Tax=uncultured Methylophaga sp. TaxID=285271 RepID=UPI002624DD8E|nr:DoxX family protein [uncultured Methylophaga sp.]|tara:strand:- start:7291 stop:7743 length:453 start_codon:yes stop_codon:yes gene_type:complete